MKASILFKKLILSCVLVTMTVACNKMDFSPVPTEDLSSVVMPPPPKKVASTEVVAYGNKQVDFLLVLDDSNSMLPELQKLAARMSSFVSSLDASNIDWQMCLTTTRGYTSGGVVSHGKLLNWSNYTPVSGPAYLLKKGTFNLNTIFTSTVNNLTIGGSGSGDERAIKATHDNFLNSHNHDCYRPGSAISVIVISDEDERSVGGNASLVKPTDADAALQPLEAADQPQTLINVAKATFGEDVRFIFSSIIVKPGDTVCEAEQDQAVSPSHPGYVYAEMSRLTDGGVGSICDADYSSNLNNFKDKIINSLSSLTLQCEPHPSSLQVKIGGLDVPGVKLDGNILKFSYPLVEGTEIDLAYECPEE